VLTSPSSNSGNTSAKISTIIVSSETPYIGRQLSVTHHSASYQTHLQDIQLTILRIEQ
jgi:hypothetical protein